ncbi:ATP-dependent Clp protease ATP-binding subunit ClpX [Lachnobacterium bovis]|uniref:ATP-dependent Clp protease ATP-binding subunit ClpX n=1 Tax=Lachnobacterium bovis TaxID=140626 RepID=A0A1H9S5J7_9FIRM|nr:ATP-dependent Clp protease ATP-binding subunit ClpX [Lachnobacterium bovis]SER79429.1 ATP-dependent Clp protease ATP-binding subunit ClpX [Lachnobacterium bovis]
MREDYREVDSDSIDQNDNSKLNSSNNTEFEKNIDVDSQKNNVNQDSFEKNNKDIDSDKYETDGAIDNHSDKNVKNNQNDNQDKDKDDDDYEEVCSFCRRPESVVGKLLHIPNAFSLCTDCMQRTLDMMKTTPNRMDDPFLKYGEFSDIPGVSFLNLSDLKSDVPKSQRLKKRTKEVKKEKPVLDINSIPAPHKIKEKLDEYVVGQDYAKKVMSVAVYNHYKRVMDDKNKIDDGIEIEKSNMLMIGPTGSGKTYLVKTLAKLLDVPLAITDATSLTEAGYIGDDIESVVSKLLAAADNDVERAEHGIIFVDEIDKIAKKKNTNQRDVSGESVQQGMLKLLEGAEVEVPVGATSKNAMVPMTMINTKDILFICGGAFPGIEDIIKERLNKQASIGFHADLKDKYDKDDNILQKVTVEDVRNFGMIPEFIGRLPILFSLEALTEDMLVKILSEPKNAIIKQYIKLLDMDEVKLEFEEDALRCIAQKAKEKKVGARALRAIIEKFMLDIMFEIPKDDQIGKVTITRDYIENKGGPVISLREN